MSNAPIPVFRISFTNATLLSGLYLVVAVAVEVVRRVWNPRWIERLSLSLEAFPARTLELLGLFTPLRQAWAENRLSAIEVRLIYGLTTVAVIFALGMLVGAAMWLIARLARRHEPSGPPSPGP